MIRVLAERERERGFPGKGERALGLANDKRELWKIRCTILS